MRRSSKWLLILLAVFVFIPIIKATITRVPTGTWVPAGNGSSVMSSTRFGAAAVQLHDGRILISGGNNGVSSVNTTDLFDAGGNLAAAPAMQFARSRHTATVLPDGSVLVAGGLDTNGVPTSTAEVFDPSTGSWTPVGSMTEARSGHTATPLADGTVLIAGGNTGGQVTNTLEIFDPGTGQFTAVSDTLSSARENHAAVFLKGGRVLIIGGWDGTYSAAQPPSSVSTPNPLATSDIFDPTTGTVSQGPALNVARMSHTATLQLDGKVFVVGGSDGTQDLASAEIFDPAASNSFTIAGVSLSTARSNHLAFLLPHNGGTMIVGGTSGGTAIASAEIYMPVYLSQTETATLAPAPSPMSIARAFAAGSPLSDGTVSSVNDGLLLVAGGTDASGNALTSSELYGFQWVRTDATDYPPGSPVTISGGGFLPGETVTLHLQEMPYIDQPDDLTAIVQPDGTFSSMQFAPDNLDLNIAFYLTATGSQSALQAQTTFTDASNPTTTVTISGTGTINIAGDVPINSCSGSCSFTSPGTQATCNSGTCKVTWSGKYSATLTPSANFRAWSGTGGCTGTGSCAASGSGNNDFAATAAFSGAATKLVYTAVPASGTAGTAFNVTVQSQDASGNPSSPTSATTVTLSKTLGGGTLSGTLTGSIPAATSTVIISGIVYSGADTLRLTATPTAGETTLTAVSTNITFSPGAVNASASTVVANPISLVADGSTTSTITITLKDAHNNPASGKTVTLSQGTGHSTISAGSGASDSNGVVTFTVKNTKAEVVTYTATDTTDNVTVTQTAQVTFTLGAVSSTVSTVSANPASIPADNSTTSTITVTLLDANSNPVSGKSVSLTAGSGSSSISPASAPTNASGVATFTVKDSAVESVIYTAKDITDDITISPTATVNFTVGPVSATTSTVSSNPASIVADDVTTSTITITLLDASSRGVSGKTVTLSAGSGSSTISAASGPSNSSGVVTFTVRDTKAETVTYTARDTSDSINLTQTAQVIFTPGTPTPGNSSISANPTSITADGSTTSTITVTLQDAHNNPVSGKTVTLSQGGGSSIITTVSNTTNASGVATFTVKDTKAEVVTYTATDATDTVTITQTAQVTFTPGPVAKFVFSAVASPQTAGTAFNVTITAQDTNGNTATDYTANGNNVSITSTGTLSGGTIATASFTNGVLANQPVTITSVGSFTLTAIGNPGHSNGSTGTSNSFTVNPGAATHFNVSAPSNATAGSPINVTITALDAYSNTATGYTGTVHFTSSDGQASLPANYTFVSGDNGVHVSSVTLKTAGNQTVTSADTVNGTISGTSGNISVSAGSAASVVATAGTPQSTGITSAFPINLGATVKDAFGNPVSGTVVTFTAPGSGASGTFAGGVNAATTNASGIATAAVFTANGTAGTYNVGASVASVASPAVFALTNNNPAPTLTAINPISGILTQTLNVTLTGTNFLNGATSVSFGADITVNSVTVNSSTQIVTSITIPSTATLGGHTVSVTNPGPGGGTASLLNAFNVTGTPPQITSVDGATFTAGSAGTFTVTTTGTPTPSLSKTGNLPSGVTFNDNGNGTATIAGATTLAGNFPILITAQNGISPSATQTFTLAVNAGPLASIVLNPASTSITAGGSAAFTATGYDQYGNSRGDVTGATTFSVTGGTCNGNLCGGTAAGVQTVSGNEGGVMNTATLTVLPGAITHLLLSPSPSIIAAGASQAYTAVGLDFYNNAAGDVTSSTTFSILPNGSCTGASCTSSVADTNGSTHMVTGVYQANGAQGQASLTVTSGSFTQLQILVPGETAAPGTTNGKTGTPSLEYVNGQFQATVNAVDQYWNVVGSVNGAIQITSNDSNAVLPANALLAAGTGTFNVTLLTPSYNPAKTILTAGDSATADIASSASALIPVIIVYTAGITPTDWATGQQATYTLTVSNAASPNTNNLSSVEIAVPQDDQGSIAIVSIQAANPGNLPVSWSYDASMQPGMMRFYANSANDSVSPGGTITVTFTATSSAQVLTNPVNETWNTVAFSDIASKNSLPLAPPEPVVSIGAASQITSAATTNAFTYQTSGTTFTITTMGVPTATISVSGSFPAWATFTDKQDGTATISGTPTTAGASLFTITAHNGYGNDATQSFTLNVNKATVMPSITAADKTYDGLTTAVVKCSLSGIIGNDDVSCSAASANFAQTDAGKSIAVNAAGISLSGGAASNYQLSTTTASTTANIDPKQVTPSITASDKPYDGTTTANILCSLTGVLGQDAGKVSCAAASANFTQAAAGNNLTVNATGITLTGPAATNYVLSTDTASTTANITPKTLIPSIVASDKVYDAKTTASVTCSLSGIVGNDKVTCTAASADFTSANAGAWQVTATGITLGGNAAPNYQLSTTTAYTNANITPATPGILVGGGPFTYDGIPHSASATATGVGGVLVTGSVIFTYTPPGDTTSPVNAGQYMVNAMFTSADPNYGNASGSGSILIKQAQASVSAADASRSYGQANPTFTGTLTGFVEADGISATYTSAAIASTPVGTYGPSSTDAIVPTLVDPNSRLANYSVTSTNGTLVINAVPLLVISPDNARSFGVADSPLTPTLEGLVAGDTAASVGNPMCAASASASSAPGSYAIVCSGVTSNNYVVRYVNGTLTITDPLSSISVSPNPASVTYGGSTILTGQGTFVSSAVRTLANAGGQSYNLHDLTATRTGAASAEAQGKLFAIGGLVSGSPSNTVEAYDPASDSWTAVASLNTARTSARAASVAGKIYVFGGCSDVACTSLVSTPEVYDPSTNLWSAISASGFTPRSNMAVAVLSDKVYVAGGNDNSGNPVSTVEVYDPGTNSWSPSAPLLKAVGPASGAIANGNLYVIGISVGNAEIEEFHSGAWSTVNSGTQPLSDVSAAVLNDVIYVVDGSNIHAYDPSANTWTDKTGLNTARMQPQVVTLANLIYVAGDTNSGAADQNALEAFASDEAKWSSSDTTVSSIDQNGKATALKVGGVTVTATSIQLPSIAGSSSLTVNPATLTVKADPQTKVYGQTDPAFTFSVTGFQFADTQTSIVTGNLTRDAGENVIPAPSYAITQGSLAANDNYTISYTANYLTITPATLTVTADHQTKVYGQNDPVLSYQVSGLQFSQSASDVLSGTLTRAPGENVAGTPYAISQGNLNANGNYTIAFTGNQLAITPATLTVKADPQTKIYGQVDPMLTYQPTGFQFADAASQVLTGALTRATGETVAGSPYAISQGTLIANSNYTISFTGNSLSITPATLTISADQRTKVYGQSDPGLTYQFSGLQFNDTAVSVLSGALDRAPGESVSGSPYSINQGTLASNSNYTISFAGAVLTITPAPLTITASSGVTIYGSAPFVVTPLLNGFVNGEGLSNLPTAPICGPPFSNASPAGSYGTSCSGPALDGNYGVTYIGGNLVVTPADTQTTVTSSLNPSTYMQLVTFTAVVANTSNGSSAIPAGTVTFNDTYNGGTTAICSNIALSIVNGQDQATCSTTTLGDAATNNVVAIFSANPANFNSSTSSALQQVVYPAPAVTLSPLSISFGNTNVGSTSSASTVILGNVGDASLKLDPGAIAITGPNASDFAFTTTCGSSVGFSSGSNSCKISIVFKPTETGVETATLQITDNDDNATNAQQFVSLTGSGLSTITGTSLYTNAIFGTSNACGAITVSGGSSVDSFNSALGYSASKQNTGGNVGTNGNITLNGSNSAIYGSAAVDNTFSGACTKSSAPGLTTNGGAKVTGGLIPLNGPITYPAPPVANPAPPTTNQNISGSCPSGMTGCTNSGSKTVTLSPGQYGNVTASGGTTIHLSKGKYNLNSLTLTGKSIVSVDAGPVVMNIAGSSLNNGSPAIDLSGGSIVNPSHIPANMQFAYGGSHGVNLTGGTDSYAVLYAPNALVNMSGGTDFFGSIIGSAVTSSGGTAVHYDTNLPNIQSGNYIWFTAVVNNLNGLPASQQAKLYLTNATVSFTVNGTQYNNLPIPNGVVTFNSSAQSSGAKTGFDLTNNRWSTNVAKNGVTGSTFVTGFAFPVPTNFPTGIQNVTISAAFSTDTPGITLQWQWNAAVYSQFNTTYATTGTPGNSNVLGVNAEDGTANTNGTDPAGTPETYKQYSTFGATGGYFSSASGIVPTVAQVSASPSSLDFGFQPVGQPSNTQQVVLTNNYSAALSISNIAIAGGDASDFQQTDNCVKSTGGFASGASCTITVTFKPSYSNFESAKIVITDTANNSPQTIYLSGTGQ